MGAAIPHLMLLATSLPLILPYPEDEITTEITTGTVQCVDEVLPAEEDEEEEEGGVQVRGKSTLEIIVKIGDGEKQGDTRSKKKHGNKGKPPRAGKKKAVDLQGVRDAPSDDEMIL